VIELRWEVTMRQLSIVLGLMIALGAAVGPAERLRAEQLEVDLALVLAVDVSYSMDPDEQELQRDGYVQAFRSPLVFDAIRKGMLGRIAVVYMDWSGAADQRVVVSWTVIDGAESSMEFADTLANSTNRRASRTSISGALDFSMRLLAESNVVAARQVIDVSGDGANNQGRLVTQARDEAIAKGITINGLPIMLKPPNGAWDVENLDLYYRDCVIGGRGAFLVPVREREQFAEAIKAKIIREVAGEAEPLLRPAQTTRPTGCLAGELKWDR
jgi:hypothetical protein